MFPINSRNIELCNENYMLIVYYQKSIYRQTGKGCLARMKIAYMVLLCIIVSDFTPNQSCQETEV